jgi:hypothetical protein
MHCIYMQKTLSASGAGGRRLLVKSMTEYKNDKYATSVSRDGDFLLFTMEIQLPRVTYGGSDCKDIASRGRSCARSSTKAQVDVLPMGNRARTHRSSPAATKFNVREFSSGIRSRTPGCRGKWLISKGGGTDPRWRGDGKELFYVASGGRPDIADPSAFVHHAMHRTPASKACRSLRFAQSLLVRRSAGVV